MLNKKKYQKLESEVSELKHEIDEINGLKIDIGKITKASDNELAVLYKYFDPAGKVCEYIAREHLNRLKLHELGIDEPRTIFGNSFTKKELDDLNKIIGYRTYMQNVEINGNQIHLLENAAVKNFSAIDTIMNVSDKLKYF